MDIYTKDEIGILAESFNKMAKNLSDDINQSDRPYRKAYSRSEAIDIIKEQSGAKLDPKIVEAFLKVLSRLDKVQDV